jgi:hypothetical protein
MSSETFLSSQALVGAVASRSAQDAEPAPKTTVSADTVRAFFFVTAPADPGLLPRLIEPVAKLGAVPSRVYASRESGDGSELGVELRLSGVSQRTARLVEFALRAVVGVHQVMAVVEVES